MPFGLEPPHPNGDLKTSRWGSTRVRIEITGREAHAALDPDSGVSAIDELVDQLIAVRRIVGQHQEVLCNGWRADERRAGIGVDRHRVRFVDPSTEEAVLATVAELQPLRAAQL